jgi:Protein of unknown function (DUF3071)
MRNLELVGLSEDGTSVVLSDAEAGETFAVALDNRLRAAVVNDRVRLGQLELALGSSLRPKEIQARIRAGQGTDEVAASAGMSVERIMRFASPVLAEREHVATQARRSVLRRAGADPMTLAEAVADRLHGRGVPPSSLAWDAWRRDDAKWTVSLHYHSGERERVAHFVYDPLARVVVTGDDESRWLAGEPGPLKGPQPRTGGRSNRPDDERAVELANEGRALRLAPIESDDEADRTTGDPELFDGPVRRSPAVRPVTELPGDPEDDAATTSIPHIEPDDLGPDEWVDLDEAQTPEIETPAAQTPAVEEPAAETPAVVEKPAAAEVPEPERPTAKPARKGKRAAVPSWDDILFGTRNDGS